jgi:hypothetical protein
LRLVLFTFFYLNLTWASIPETQSNTDLFIAKLQNNKTVIYNSGNISIKGFYGNGIIQIYSIIGNKIIDLKVQELNNYNVSVSLQANNMFIIRVLNNNEIKTFKIVVNP